MRSISSPLTVVLVALFFFPIGISARVRVVPGDHDTIQAAINASRDSDTVLVNPGEYRENIDFGGRDIVVGSLFLITGDEAYIDSTIIDGRENDAPVAYFHTRENPEALLTGFTLTNGSGHLGGENRFGGAINVLSANPTLSYLMVENSEATFGAGIYLERTNDALYYSLKGQVQELHLVGQALSPRRLLDSIADAYVTARAL